MSVQTSEVRKPGHWETSWDELMTGGYDAGLVVGRLDTGDGDDDVVIFKVVFPAHCTVSPHTHDVDYVELILEGTQKVGKTWHKAGDIRVVKAGTVYGPLIAGPEGATVLNVMSGKNCRARPPRHGAPITITIGASAD